MVRVFLIGTPIVTLIEITLVKDQCRLDIRKYLFSQRTINEWNILSMDFVTASNVNMFKNKVDTSQEGGLHINENCVDSR